MYLYDFDTCFYLLLMSSTVNELLAGSVGKSFYLFETVSIIEFVGGATQVLVGQPLDTIKTRAQIAPSTFSGSYLLYSLYR